MADYTDNRITAKAMADIFRLAKKEGIVTDQEICAVFYDLSFLEFRIKEVIASFGKSSLHTVAIKANPLISVLRKYNGLGVGAEAASLPELYLAQKAGFTSDRIVFDSPVKTVDDLKYAMKAGVFINADSLDELDRISELKNHVISSSKYGLRINPQVGSGRIKTTGVAAEYSKFGVPIKESHREIIDAYHHYNWLTGIHLHTGSQGIELGMLVDGIKAVYELTEEINSGLKKSGASNMIDTFDIGGGMPVTYKTDDRAPTVAEYARMLENGIPGLFDGRYKLVTEFGRYINANAAWAMARVEYLKKQGGIGIVLTHLGADMFVRKCYNPDDWHHDISVIDSYGRLKSGAIGRYIIAGPLCFAGDIIARDLALPQIEVGDFILIHDVGAYTLSMWSRYNSRQIPAVTGYRNSGREFEVLKKRESLDDVYNFWG